MCSGFLTRCDTKRAVQPTTEDDETSDLGRLLWKQSMVHVSEFNCFSQIRQGLGLNGLYYLFSVETSMTYLVEAMDVSPSLLKANTSILHAVSKYKFKGKYSKLFSLTKLWYRIDKPLLFFQK